MKGNPTKLYQSERLALMAKCIKLALALTDPVDSDDLRNSRELHLKQELNHIRALLDAYMYTESLGRGRGGIVTRS